MHRTTLIAFGTLLASSLAISARAQTAAEALNKQLKQAPAGVEQKLRDRVAAFYEFLIADQARKAESLVLEEDRDTFYKLDKPRYESYKIEAITWNDDFTQATVLTQLGYILKSPQLGGSINTILPARSTWDLHDGNWFVEYRQNSTRELPGGVSHPGPEPGGNPDLQSKKAVTKEDLQRAVKFSKRDLLLDPTKAGEDSLTITNTLPGPIDLELPLETSGNVTFALDRKTLASGESAHLTVAYTPAATAPTSKIAFLMKISPLDLQYALSVDFAVANKPPQ